MHVYYMQIKMEQYTDLFNLIIVLGLGGILLKNQVLKIFCILNLLLDTIDKFRREIHIIETKQANKLHITAEDVHDFYKKYKVI